MMSSVMALALAQAMSQPAAAAAVAPPVPALVAAAPAVGATYTSPPGWAREPTSPTMTTFVAPEGDLRMAVVEVGSAADASAAAVAAWQAFRPGFQPKVELATKRPARNGWDEVVAIDYETSPGEHRVTYAHARRAGTRWTVTLVDGSQATAEKRGAAAQQMTQSMRPAGYTPESFAGRTAHPLDAARIAQLLDFVRTGAKELGVPGVGISLIEKDRILFEGGVGVRELGKPAPVDANTRFMIASNTKSMATLLLAKLVDEGKLRWDEPVTQAYPGFRLGSDATTAKVQIRHLVCACTGLPRKDMERVFTGNAKTPALDAFRQLALTEPTSGFGEAFQYNNLMATAAGYVGAHLAFPKMEIGAAFDRAMSEKIFTPLGMRHTTFSMSEALAGNYAKPHSEPMQGVVHVIPQGINYAIAPFRPAGGAWSTPHDMILYVRNELDEGRLANGTQLVSAANLLKRRERGVPVGDKQWYGMGLMEDSRSGVPVIHHGGDLSGYHSDMIMIPGAGVGAVILTNSDNGPALRGPFMRRLLELLYDGKPEAAEDVAMAAKRNAAQSTEFFSKLTQPADPVVIAALAPRYRNAELGTLTLTRRARAHPRITANNWASSIATRKEPDGSVSIVTTDPAFLGQDMLVGKDAAGKGTLTVRDGQHVYLFTAG